MDDAVDDAVDADELVDHIAEILMRCCPTEHEHSYQVAGTIVRGLGLKMEVREGDRLGQAGVAPSGGRREFRYVTDWLQG